MISACIKKIEDIFNGDCFACDVQCIKKTEALSSRDCFVYDMYLHKENRSFLHWRLFC